MDRRANGSRQVLCGLPEALLRCLILRSAMALAHSAFLFGTPPISFRGFLRDSLIAFGLPYGPQVHERLAQAVPDLFGRSGVTLSGYCRWLARTGRQDNADSFSAYMENRYQRWRALR